MFTEQLRVPPRTPDATWHCDGLTCDVYDEGSRRLVHMCGEHYGQCGLVHESIVATRSSVGWLAELFQHKKNWTVNELLRAEGPLSGQIMDFYRDRFGVEITNRRVLELGCGLGASTIKILEEEPLSVVAMDIDGPALELARRRINDFGFTAPTTFIRMSASGVVPVKDASFGLVVAFEVFEHVPPSLRGPLLQELYRKLEPGGHLLVASPNRLSPKDLHTSGLWLINYMPLHIAACYARLASSRCRGMDNEQLISAGLVPFSWWQARSALKKMGAIDLSQERPDSQGLPPTSSAAGTFWNRIARGVGKPLSAAFHCPPDAFFAHLFLAYQRPEDHNSA